MKLTIRRHAGRNSRRVAEGMHRSHASESNVLLRSAVQSELFLVCTTGVSLRAGVDPAKRRQLPPTAERFDQ